MKTSGVLLKAEWRKLAMVNYAVAPEVLEPWLPCHTELDLWNGVCYVSLVGFRFINTRIRGIKVPFHTHFGEINLRFYIKHQYDGVWRRGVVFVKEIVPRPALTLIANTLYKENYVTMPVAHQWELEPEYWNIRYEWGRKPTHSLQLRAGREAIPVVPDSEEAFITEHYWGYTRLGPASTALYEVQHPRWEVYPVHQYEVKVDFAGLYGPQFAFLKEAEPRSVLLAEGSAIQVRKSITL